MTHCLRAYDVPSKQSYEKQCTRWNQAPGSNNICSKDAACKESPGKLMLWLERQHVQQYMQLGCVPALDEGAEHEDEDEGLHKGIHHQQVVQHACVEQERLKPLHACDSHTMMIMNLRCCSVLADLLQCYMLYKQAKPCCSDVKH